MCTNGKWLWVGLMWSGHIFITFLNEKYADRYSDNKNWCDSIKLISELTRSVVMP